MAHWLRRLVTLPEDLSAFPSLCETKIEQYTLQIKEPIMLTPVLYKGGFLFKNKFLILFCSIFIVLSHYAFFSAKFLFLKSTVTCETYEPIYMMIISLSSSFIIFFYQFSCFWKHAYSC